MLENLKHIIVYNFAYCMRICYVGVYCKNFAFCMRILYTTNFS